MLLSLLKQPKIIFNGYKQKWSFFRSHSQHMFFLINIVRLYDKLYNNPLLPLHHPSLGTFIPLNSKIKINLKNNLLLLFFSVNFIPSRAIMAKKSTAWKQKKIPGKINIISYWSILNADMKLIQNFIKDK